MDALELGTPAWGCLPSPWRYPGGRHTLSTVKGVLMAFPAVPPEQADGGSRVLGGHQQRLWGLGRALRGDSWIWSAPLPPGTLVTMETNSCLGGFGCLLPLPTPPTHMWRWEGGQVACGGGASHTLPPQGLVFAEKPFWSLRGLPLVERGTRIKGINSWVLSSQLGTSHKSSHFFLSGSCQVCDNSPILQLRKLRKRRSHLAKAA